MIRSRLSKKMENKTKKNFALSILGIIITILVVLKFGIPLMVNVSLFLSGFKNKEVIKIQNASFIAPPILDSNIEATASAEIAISGITSKKQPVNLYVNDELTNTTKADDKGKFIFKEDLKPGQNTIKATTIVNDKESDYSNIITIVYKSAPPSLNISTPSDNQSFSKDQNVIEVKGITDSDVKITVNNYWAITDGNGNFSYNLHLRDGENRIKVIATDIAGNKKESEIKVTYSP
jgi:hypothetical protein